VVDLINNLFLRIGRTVLSLRERIPSFESFNVSDEALSPIGLVSSTCRIENNDNATSNLGAVAVWTVLVGL